MSTIQGKIWARLGVDFLAVPYRQPAEDEEAKRDAAEIAALAERLRRQKTRDARLFLTFWVLGGATLVGCVWLASAMSPTPNPGPGCHVAYRLTAANTDAVVRAANDAPPTSKRPGARVDLRPPAPTSPHDTRE